MDIDACLDLMQKEIADHEQRLIDRQLEIILKLNSSQCVPVENITFLANAMILIAHIRVHGTSVLLDMQDRMIGKEYVLDFIGRQPVSEALSRIAAIEPRRGTPAMHNGEKKIPEVKEKQCISSLEYYNRFNVEAVNKEMMGY